MSQSTAALSWLTFGTRLESWTQVCSCPAILKHAVKARALSRDGAGPWAAWCARGSGRPPVSDASWQKGTSLQSQQLSLRRPHSLRQLACRFEASPLESSCQGLSPRRGAVTLTPHPHARRRSRARSNPSPKGLRISLCHKWHKLCSPSPRLSAAQAGHLAASPPKAASSTGRTNVTLSSLRHVCPADSCPEPPPDQHLGGHAVPFGGARAGLLVTVSVAAADVRSFCDV